MSNINSPFITNSSSVVYQEHLYTCSFLQTSNLVAAALCIKSCRYRFHFHIIMGKKCDLGVLDCDKMIGARWADQSISKTSVGTEQQSEDTLGAGSQKLEIVSPFSKINLLCIGDAFLLGAIVKSGDFYLPQLSCQLEPGWLFSCDCSLLSKAFWSAGLLLTRAFFFHIKLLRFPGGQQALKYSNQPV